MQPNPVNPGWGRKGSAGAGRTSSPAGWGLLPGGLACGRGTGDCRTGKAPPVSSTFPAWHTGSSVCSQEQHHRSPVPGRGSWVPRIRSAPWVVIVCLDIQSSFSGLGDSRADYKAHAQQGKVMISS